MINLAFKHYDYIQDDDKKYSSAKQLHFAVNFEAFLEPRGLSEDCFSNDLLIYRGFYSFLNIHIIPLGENCQNRNI